MTTEPDICVCCGRRVNEGYRFCIGCERKRVRVYGDCVAGGLSEEQARQKVELVYPCRFAAQVAPQAIVDKSGRRYVFNGKAWIRE